MKKLFSVLLAAVMVMTLAVTAFAAKSYTVEELGVTLEIPDDYFVFTRNTQADDPLFDLVGLDYTALMQIMESGNIYLDAISVTGKEIMLIVNPVSGMDSYTGYGEETILALEEEYREVFKNQGLELQEYGVYKSGGYAYMKAIAYSESLDVYIAQYMNFIDGKAYALGFRSTEEITDSEISMTEKIVDSISYDFADADVPATQEDTTYSFDFGGVDEDSEDEYADDEYAKDEYEEDEDTDDEYDEDVYADGYDSEPSSDSSFSIPGYVFIIIIVILVAVIAAIVLVVIKGKKKQASSADANPTVQGNYPPAQPPVQNVYTPAPQQPQYNPPVVPVQNIQPEEIRPTEPVQQSKLPEEAPTIVAAPAQPAAEEAPKASFCSNCGAAVAEGGAFCPMCGTRIG